MAILVKLRAAPRSRLYGERLLLGLLGAMGNAGGMIRVDFPDQIHPSHLTLLCTPGTPAVLTIDKAIRLRFAGFFFREYEGIVDPAWRDALLSHPIILVGGSIAARAHVTCTLRPIDATSATIAALDYFVLESGWAKVIVDGVMLTPGRDPDPAWL